MYPLLAGIWHGAHLNPQGLKYADVLITNKKHTHYLQMTCTHLKPTQKNVCPLSVCLKHTHNIILSWPLIQILMFLQSCTLTKYSYWSMDWSFWSWATHLFLKRSALLCMLSGLMMPEIVFLQCNLLIADQAGSRLIKRPETSRYDFDVMLRCYLKV